MKKLLVVAFALLTTVAVGQTYHYTAPIVPARQDVTTMTTSVNAWKVFPGNPVCDPQTLEFGKLDKSHSCIGTDGYIYKFDRPTKTWIKQTAMGTPSYIAVVNFAGSSTQANIYALIRTTACNVYNGSGGLQFYDVFHWNGSQWVQPAPGSCVASLSADYKGNLNAIGWDINNRVSAWFRSTNGGTSWTLLVDSYKFINMQDDQEGCAISTGNSIWEVFPSNTTTPSSFPALPSGTAAGCTVVENPFVMMAWNTSGQAYIIVDGNTAWQAVTGISLQRAGGVRGHFIFGEDNVGKVYHWNTNAPGMISTYGGQWSQSQGCPTPGTPCNNNTTHTLHHSLHFNTCHGINGCAESQSTQLWSANFSLPHSDYNPQCDPYFGGGVDDPECHVTESSYGHCNASGATLDPTGDVTYVVADSIDVMDWIGNDGSTGPLRVQTVLYQGYYTGTVTNNVKDACFVSDPVPQCPASLLADIDIKTEWYGKLDAEAAAYNKELAEMAKSRIGADAPYVYRSFYLAEELPDGTLTDVHCFPAQPNEPDDFLDGNYDLQPHCK